MNDFDDDYRNRSRQTSDEDNGSLKKPLITSAIIHGAVILFLIVGMPHISTRDFDAPPPVMVELAPISDMAQTNRIPVKAPKTEEKKPEPPKPQEEKVKKSPKKSEPAPKPAEKKPEPPKPAEKKPKVKKEAIAEKPPEEKLEQPEPPKPEPKKEEEKVEKKPEVKEEEPKKEEDSEAALDSLLKDLSPTDTQYEAPDQDIPTENTSATPAPDVPLGATLSMTELDALRYQLSQCWNIPAGAQGADDLNVEVKIIVNTDRTAQSVTIVDQARYNSDSFFRAAADSARRAVLNPNCSPLKLPPEKYDQWKVTYVNFNPKDMF